jgi:hypothetical protein|tara:strand:+ start:2084 stop:3106 length:1023 start_codon:yes stop_codon:yes gene_type:complete
MDLNKTVVTKEGLLKHIEDVDVYRFYTGKEVDLNSKISSPLRKDSNPSFGYFFGQSGELCFKDFVLGAGDFVKFVQWKFNLNFFEALSKIVIDFGLDQYFMYKHDLPLTERKYDPNDFSNRSDLANKSAKFKLGVRQCPFTAKDYAFWLQFGVDSDMLQKYNVIAIDYIFINQNPFYVKGYAYAFVETKDGKKTYKIYQPFSQDFKWLNNHDDSVWQGWTQLPEQGVELIITKSLKDVMSIKAVTGIDTVSLQSESVKPKDHIIKELKDRFNTIFLLYDNDFDKEQNWGRQLGSKLAVEHDLVFIEIPTQLQSKDFSDLVKNHGKETGVKVIDHLTGVPF